MKEFKRGERVKFLNDVGIGTVTRLIDKEMVMVRTEDGFEYPVLKSELIRSAADEPEAPSEAEIKDSVVPSDTSGQQHEELKDDIKGRDVSGAVSAFMAIVPLDCSEPVSGEAEIFLINDSEYNLLYHCSASSGGFDNTLAAGKLDPDMKLLIGTMHLDDLFGRGKGINVSIIPFTYGRQPRTVPVNQIISPGREFMSERSSYKENDYTDNDAFVVSLYGKDQEEGDSPDQLRQKLVESLNSGVKVDKGGEDTPRKPEKKSRPGIEEVDLHIGEIVESTSGLSSGDILKIQIDRFRTSLDGAILSRQSKVVYIHGAGEGKLKHEIRRIIDRDYPRCRYQDASFKEYGFGATMVLIK